MMKIKYKGPFGSVVIPDFGNLVVEAGVEVEVPDRLGKSLVEQDVWSEVKSATAPTTKAEPQTEAKTEKEIK